MKRIFLPVMLVLAFVLAACGGQPETPASTPTAEVISLSSQSALIEALKAQGATVEVGEALEQPFLKVKGQILKVNGADVQVFEYPTNTEMEADATQISPDGASTVTTMITWIDTPHFYKMEKLMVLYVGSDPTILDLLTRLFGPQFAGG